MADPGTLTLADDSVEQGIPLRFHYTVTAAKEDATNWIGIYSDPGGGPVDGAFVGASTAYVYAPGTSGDATINSGILAAGKYLAFYLYKNGYESLAPAVPFQVANVPQQPAPPYSGEFGRAVHWPAGMSLDGRGHLLVADPGSKSVQVFTKSGRLVRSVGSRRLRDPQAVAATHGLMFVADATLGTVEVFTSHGRHVRSIGKGQLERPRGVAVTDAGRVLVSDVGNNRVARFDAATGRLRGEITDVHIPHGITIDGPRTWVVSSSRQYDGDCGITCFVDDKPTITLGYGQHSVFGALSNPAHVAIDREGLVLVSVPDYGFVSRFRQTGQFVGEFGTFGRGLLRFPQGVVTLPDGRVLVADTGNGRVVEFGGAR